MKWTDHLLYGLVVGLCYGLGRLPVVLQAGIGRLLVGLYRLFGQKEVATLRENVSRIFGLPAGSHFAKMFESQVLHHEINAAFDLFRYYARPDSITIEGLGELKEVIDPDRGGIICTAHIGSWEFCALVVAKVTGKTFHVLAKPTRVVALTRLMESIRGRLGAKVFWTDRKSLVRDMLGTLKKGQTLGFVMDQKPEGRKGPVVDFFGIPTAFVSGPATMALKTGTPVYTIFCLRVAPGHYRVFCHLIPVESGETEQTLTAKLAAEIEAVIRLYPEQWTWNYRRWRFKPRVSGEALLTTQTVQNH